MRTSQVGWAVDSVVAHVTAPEASDGCKWLPWPIMCDGQCMVHHGLASGFGVLAGFLSSKADDDIIKVEGFGGGRVKCENKILVGGGEPIGECKDDVFIRDIDPNLRWLEYMSQGGLQEGKRTAGMEG